MEALYDALNAENERLLAESRNDRVDEVSNDSNEVSM